MGKALGQDARDLVRELLRSMTGGKPELATAIEEAKKSDLWMECLWNAVERKLVDVFDEGRKDRERSSDFRDLRERADSQRRALDRERWERERIHGDIDI